MSLLLFKLILVRFHYARRIGWRGDRIEWMLAHGFHEWFLNEIKEDRVLWPGPALPAPMP